MPQYYALGNGDIFVNVGSGAAINYTQVITGVTSTRASNSIAYFSPSFAGFRVHAAHYFGENLSNGANSNDGTGDGIRLAYATGPFSAEVAYGRTKYQAGDSVQRNIGFQYNFGVAKVVGDFNRDRAGTLSSKGGALGMSVPVGVGEIRTGYSWHKTDAAGNPEAKKLGVGYVHNLSKRTAVYTTYARVRNSGGSAVALAGASTAGNSSSSGFDIGVRHNF